MHMKKLLNRFTLQQITWAYFLMFVFLVGMNYVPFFYAENGRVFGMFRLEPIANWLHVLSGVWALLAVLKSRAACLFYFRAFGTAYFIDGMSGVVFGKAYLNLRLFDPAAIPVVEMSTRLILNTPHLVIGGLAIIIGFVWYKHLR